MINENEMAEDMNMFLAARYLDDETMHEAQPRQPEYKAEPVGAMTLDKVNQL